LPDVLAGRVLEFVQDNKLHPLIKMARLLTHINIDATFALLAWLVTSFPSQASRPSASHQSTAIAAEGGVQ
jgi:hypothetical protein